MESQIIKETIEPGEVQEQSWFSPQVNRPAMDCSICTSDFESFLSTIEEESVDLVLTDPPYAISRNTGFQHVGKRSVERFAVSMDFGEWDQKEINLTTLAQAVFKVLRKGGTTIIFYDLWKITKLADALTSVGFVQLRLIEWLKTNPVPLNSKVNYLTNAREVAVLAVKGGKPTFNGVYDNGVYRFPITRGKRLHPTQKPLRLFRELVKKHSHPGDLVVDPFLGSGTSAIAAYDNSRRFKGCDVNSMYTSIAQKRVEDYEAKHAC